ncbi:unnamed protein product, partial [Polarella glacialis]
GEASERTSPEKAGRRSTGGGASEKTSPEKAGRRSTGGEASGRTSPDKKRTSLGKKDDEAPRIRLAAAAKSYVSRFLARACKRAAAYESSPAGQAALGAAVWNAALEAAIAQVASEWAATETRAAASVAAGIPVYSAGQKLVAVSAYAACNGGELGFAAGAIITCIKQDDKDLCLYHGKLSGLTGIFPHSHVQPYVSKAETHVQPCVFQAETGQLTSEAADQWHGPEPQRTQAPEAGNQAPEVPRRPSLVQGIDGEAPPANMVGGATVDQDSSPPAEEADNSNTPVYLPGQKLLAVFDYEARNQDELAFQEGDVITCLRQEEVDRWWYRGELNGKSGIFPNNYVELYETQDLVAPEDNIMMPQQIEVPTAPKAPHMSRTKTAALGVATLFSMTGLAARARRMLGGKKTTNNNNSGKSSETEKPAEAQSSAETQKASEAQSSA